jgi:hypothetical protein
MSKMPYSNSGTFRGAASEFQKEPEGAVELEKEPEGAGEFKKEP